MIVAMDEHAGPGLGALAQWRPQGFPLGDGLLAQPVAGVEARIPFDEQVGAGLQRQIVVGKQGPATF